MWGNINGRWFIAIVKIFLHNLNLKLLFKINVSSIPWDCVIKFYVYIKNNYFPWMTAHFVFLNFIVSQVRQF